MARKLAWSSIIVVVVFCGTTVLIAFVKGHEAAGVTMFMVYGAAAWAYAVLTFTGQRAIPENVDLHEEFARRIGFVSYERLELFEYVLAPWLAGLSGPFLMVIGLAIALTG
ncbi:MAG: hypothetical protein WCC70_05410 [Candidatus Aquilonibacter sp.]